MENFFDYSISDLLQHYVLQLFCFAVIVMLGITGFFGWRYREIKQRMERLESPAKRSENSNYPATRLNLQ